MIEQFKNYNIFNKINQAKMTVCVVCYGGCASNMMVDNLEKNGFKCRSDIWTKLLCHSPEIIHTTIPIIYVYRDPVQAYLSMKRRGSGIWDINQRKLSNNNNVKLSDENLLQLMIRQFKMWVDFKNKHPNVKLMIVKYEELFDPNFNTIIESFMNKQNMKHFPIEYNKPHITMESVKNDISEKDLTLFEKYKTGIDFINNYSSKCSTFE